MSEIEKVALTCETSSIYLQVICSQIGKANCSIVNNQHGRRNNSVCTAVELFRRSYEAERTLKVGRWQLAGISGAELERAENLNAGKHAQCMQGGVRVQ